MGMLLFCWVVYCPGTKLDLFSLYSCRRGPCQVSVSRNGNQRDPFSHVVSDARFLFTFLSRRSTRCAIPLLTYAG